MTRTVTDTTKRQIVALRFSGPLPAKLRTAVHDALHDRPVSLERERWLCAELGIEAPRRRAYWRPCLPASLTPQQRAQVLEFAALLQGGA